MNYLIEGVKYIYSLYKGCRGLSPKVKCELRNLPIKERLYVLSVVLHKPMILSRVSNTHVTLLRDGKEEFIKLDKIKRIEKNNDPLLGLVYKLYLTDSEYLLIDELPEPALMRKMVDQLGVKYIEK